jgi:hypothetical protein
MASSPAYPHLAQVSALLARQAPMLNFPVVRLAPLAPRVPLPPPVPLAALTVPQGSTRPAQAVYLARQALGVLVE